MPGLAFFKTATYNVSKRKNVGLLFLNQDFIYVVGVEFMAFSISR